MESSSSMSSSAEASPPAKLLVPLRVTGPLCTVDVLHACEPLEALSSGGHACEVVGRSFKAARGVGVDGVGSRTKLVRAGGFSPVSATKVS